MDIYHFYCDAKAWQERDLLGAPLGCGMRATGRQKKTRLRSLQGERQWDVMGKLGMDDIHFPICGRIMFLNTSVGMVYYDFPQHMGCYGNPIYTPNIPQNWNFIHFWVWVWIRTSFRAQYFGV